MPSNKTSLYDGSVHIVGTSLDLTGKIAAADGAFTRGDATITVDHGIYDWVVGDKVYACESSGDGRLKLVGVISSITVNSGTSGSSNLDATRTITGGARISVANNGISVNVPPKLEIAAIQIIESGTLTTLVPVRNYYPGHTFSDGTTTWADEPSVSYYGATDGASGVVYGLGDVDSGITIEGRWKHVTVSSADACMCHLKAVPSSSIV